MHPYEPVPSSSGEANEEQPSRWSRGRLGVAFVCVAAFVSVVLFSGSTSVSVTSLTKGFRGAAFPTPLSLKKSSSSDSTTEDSSSDSTTEDSSTDATFTKDKETSTNGAIVTSTVTLISALGSGSWSAIGADPTASSIKTFYVTDSSNGQFKATTDGGTTFTTTTPFTYTYGGSTGVIPIKQLAVTSSGVVYAAAQYYNMYGGGQYTGKIFYSSNSGSTWLSTNPHGTSKSTYSYICVGVSSTGNYILTADEWNKQAFVYSSSATSWGTGYTLAGYPTGCAVSSTGQYMFILTYSGVYYSSNYGSTWTLTTSAPASSSTSSITTSNSGSTVLVTSYQSCYLSTNYGASFSLMSGCLDMSQSSNSAISAVSGVVSGDGTNIAVLQYEEQNYWQITYPLAYTSIRTTQDKGASWSTNSRTSLWFPTKLLSNTDQSALIVTAATKSYNYMGSQTYYGKSDTIRNQAFMATRKLCH